MIEPTDADVGRGVIYVPGHAKGDRTHPDCEVGVITSFNPFAVFVRYGADRTSKGTNRRDLVWETETREASVSPDATPMERHYVAALEQIAAGSDGLEAREIATNALESGPITSLTTSLQEDVDAWVLDTFGESLRNNVYERVSRVLEEVVELAQACRLPVEQARRIFEDAYARPVGSIHQEAAGVGVTLYALTAAIGLDLEVLIKREILRIWRHQDVIRRKQAAKAARGLALPLEDEG